MMVSVFGVSDSEQAAIIERLVRYCVLYYFTEEEAAEFNITIRSDLSLLERKRFAECSVRGRKQRYPTCFEIGLVTNGVSFMDQLRLIAHEMVHLKQFNTGEFDVLDGGCVFRWQDSILEAVNIPDWCEPWELEARSMEKAHVEMFVAKHDLRHSTWYKQCV